QRRQCLRLLFKSPQPVRIRHNTLWQHLYRDFTIEPRISRAKHFAHAACAEGSSDSILIECFADHVTHPVALRCSAIQRTIFSSSSFKGIQPDSSTRVWNSRMSKRGPSA